MSAISIVRPTEQIAAIFTDGAMFSADGTLTNLGQKVAILGHIQTAIAARGVGSFVLGMHAQYTHANSFEDVLESLPQVARDCEAEIIRRTEFYGKSFEFWVVGYSHERQRTEGYFLCTHSLAPGVEPFELIELDWLSSAPNPVPDWQAPERNSFDLVKDGAALMDAQRRQLDRQFGEGDAIHAGGFAQLTTVTRDGVTSSIIHRWPDRVGMEQVRDSAGP